MKKNIAIIMGGYSSEHDISVKSAGIVYKHLPKEKYNTYKVLITPKEWLVSNDKDTFPINKNDFSFQTEEETIRFDAVFNAIHGTPGEDGKLLHYLELLGIPHSSAPAYLMGLTFNKKDCLSVLQSYGIPSATSVFIHQDQPYSIPDIIEKVGLPCFVKPNQAGSSFGISKVHKIEEMEKALSIAFKEDATVIIEAFLDGPEISVGLIEYQGKIQVLPMTEIVSENDFFDYEAKYLGKSQEITPARISDSLHAKIAEIAKKAYTSLGMSGFSRSEFIIVKDTPYFLEMNTVPGLTAESILPQQAKAAGITLENLFSNAIETAIKNKN